jgi:hypothetical protein
VSQQLEVGGHPVPPISALAPPITTKAARRKRAHQDLDAEIAKRQRITLGKNNSKDLLETYSLSTVSVGGAQNSVGTNFTSTDVNPMLEGGIPLDISRIKNPGGIQVAEVSVREVSPVRVISHQNPVGIQVAEVSVREVSPVEVISQQNPGGIQVAEVSVKEAFVPGDGGEPKYSQLP